MPKHEEKSVIIKILSLYLLTTAIFLGVFFSLYYDRGYRLIIHEKSNDLREDYEAIMRVLDKNTKLDKLALERIENLDLGIEFAIYDKNNNILYDGLSSLPAQRSLKKSGVYVSKGYIFLNSKPIKYRKYHKKISNHPVLGLEYKVIIRGDYIVPDIWWLRLKTAIFLLLSLSLVGVIAYFLLKLSLKPLRDKIAFLNRFIKDTTHEINTPISVILMSIERLNTHEISAENLKKINRIQIAAKTITNIYQNLVFYSFSKKINQRVCIDMKEFLEQRLEFFMPLFAQKNLEIIGSLENSSINAHKDGIRCIVDNLLSNAIKYNKEGGKVIINLGSNSLRIADEGCGIDEDKKSKIFERYARYDTSVGGFGIGLALVRELCEFYGIFIKYESVVNKGSVFFLQWEK